MTTVHLIQGYLGVGKTTFAKQLTQRTGATRFSIDEWYLRLYTTAPTHELNPDQWQRVEHLIAELWPPLVQRGVDVVLDLGFWKREMRDRARHMASECGADARLYWIRCDDGVALKRCLERNGSADAFLISESGYHDLKPRFEPPAQDEAPQIVVTG